MLTEKLPNNSFKPVTLNRLPYPVDTYAQPVARRAVWQPDQTEVLTTQPLPLIVDLFILPGLGQQHGLGKGLSSHASQTVLLIQGGLNGQPLTALGPTTVDNSPPVLGLHSRPKTMGTVSFKVAGLKSSLTHDRIPFLYYGLSLAFLAISWTHSCNTNKYAKKICPAIKLAIVPRASQHVKHFPEAVTNPKIVEIAKNRNYNGYSCVTCNFVS